MLTIYSDGSSGSKTGLPVGWAYVVLWHGDQILEGSDSHPAATNNIAELMGAIDGLKAAAKWILDHPEALDSPIILISDSQYVVGLANREYRASANKKLVDRLQKLMDATGAKAAWIKGHSGARWNERVDFLSRAAKEKLKARLAQEHSNSSC